MNLVRKALEKQGTRRNYIVPASDGELRLFIAYCENEISFGQLVYSLGRSYGYANSWVRHMTDYLLYRRQLVFTLEAMNVKSL